MAPVQDQVVIVTGGASGIGLAVVRLLLARGAKVMLGDKNPATARGVLDELAPAAGGRLAFRETDVRSQAENQALFDAALDKWGQVDAVVLNAGFPGSSWWEDVERGRDDWQAAVDVMVSGVMGMSRIACTHWTRADKKGAVVITASMAAFWAPLQGPGGSGVAYSTVKGSNIYFAKSLQGAMDGYSVLKGKGPVGKIRANAVMPGWVWTGIMQEAAKQSGMPLPKTPDEWDAAISTRAGVPSMVSMLGGWVPHDKLAAAYVRCIEDESLRGQCWTVNGEAAEPIEYPRPEFTKPGGAFDMAGYIAKKPKL